MSDSYDIIVVGAGCFGLAAAKSYLEMYPSERMVVLDAGKTCGGTWADDRLYPCLKTNNMIGSYELADFPMTEERYDVKNDAHIPGTVVNRYFKDYAEHFGVFERIIFNTTVEIIKPSSSGWSLTVKGPNGERQIETAKLILATGLTNTPNMPQFQNADSFNAPIFHAKELCKQIPNIKDAKNVVVVGGAKSAFDMSYAMVEQGATVDMIIRPGGNGPLWMLPRFVTPLKKRIDTLLCIRWMTWMAPCPWGGEDGYSTIRNFLHGTTIGRFIVDAFWKVLGGDVLSLNNYDGHPETKKLKPWNSPFWTGSNSGVLGYERPIFEDVKSGNIKVHIDTIDHLQPKEVVLASGETLHADAIICATGWKPDASFKFSGIDECEIGLDYDAKQLQQLNDEADAKVCAMFPRLKDQPKLSINRGNAEPLRLYRFMVPSTMLAQHNIALAGMVSAVTTGMVASAQGLWIAAFLHGKLDRVAETEEEITQEIMLHTQWGKWRHPCGFGARLPDIVFEGVPYVDMLLRDMKLNYKRKKTLLQDLTWPYSPTDFDGLIGEWKASHE